MITNELTYCNWIMYKNLFYDAPTECKISQLSVRAARDLEREEEPIAETNLMYTGKLQHVFGVRKQ
jgi:hypothetical protein